MAHDPKLEIYKLILERKGDRSPVTFREFFRSKLNHYLGIKPTPKTNKDILNAYLEDFLKYMGLSKYKTDNKRQKGFTIAKERVGGTTKTRVSLSSNEMFIHGLFFGGRFNAKRLLGVIDDTAQSSEINRKNIVSDRFYFLIYTPLDHCEGVVIVQGYSESRISDIVKKTLAAYFKYHREWSSEFEQFIPHSYREEYMKNAKFQKVVFSSGWKVPDGYEDIIGKNEHELTVKIEIIDRNSKKVEVNKIRQLVERLGKSKFKIAKGNEKELGEFDNMEAKMESNGKSLAFDFDDENNISPTILLTDPQFFSEDELNFEAIHDFCCNLLAEIKAEILPSNGVKEL